MPGKSYAPQPAIPVGLHRQREFGQIAPFSVDQVVDALHAAHLVRSVWLVEETPDNELAFKIGGIEITTAEYLRHLALCRIFFDNIPRIRTSVLTQNQQALEGLNYGADDFDLPIEDEVTQKAGATISLDFERILNYARELGYEPKYRHVARGLTALQE